MAGFDGLISSIAAIPEGVDKEILAAKQRKEANSINPVRPTRGVPAALTQATNIAQNAANQGELPGASTIRDQIAASTADAARNNNDTASGAESVYGNALLTAKKNNNLLTLGVEGADAQRKAQGALAGELGKVGNEQDENFNYNEAEPYMMAVQKQAQLNNDSEQNKFGGISDLSSAAANGVIGGLTGGASLLGGTGGKTGGASGVSAPNGNTYYHPTIPNDTYHSNFDQINNSINSFTTKDTTPPTQDQLATGLQGGGGYYWPN